jgi:drug/metabolite transporter (DMT)-like permease
MTAAVTIVIRRLGATEAAPTTVFWFAVSSLIPLTLLMPFFGQLYDPAVWTILFVVALSGGLAQLTLTAALRFAPVALVMPMDYTMLIWASLLGALLFGQLPSPWTWFGAPVVIGSGLVILWREHRLRRLAGQLIP